MSQHATVTPPYSGNEPYLFVSYSHAQKKEALAIIEALTAKGCRVFYDGGEHRRGEEPSLEYLDKIRRSAAFLVLVSPHSASSANVRREIRCLGKDVPVIAVRLEKTALDPEMSFYMKNAVWIDKKKPSLLSVFKKKDPKQDAWELAQDIYLAIVSVNDRLR